MKYLTSAAVGLVLAGGACSSLASAATLQRTVDRNKATAILAMLVYSESQCGIYPPREIKVSVKPGHGTASIVKAPVTMPATTGVCAGTKGTIPWLVYRVVQFSRL